MPPPGAMTWEMKDMIMMCKKVSLFGLSLERVSCKYEEWRSSFLSLLSSFKKWSVLR